MFFNKNEKIEVLKTEKKSLLNEYKYICFFKYNNNDYMFNLTKYKNSDLYDLEIDKIKLFKNYEYDYLKNIYHEYKLSKQEDLSKERNYFEFDEVLMKKLQEVGLINSKHKIEDIEIKNSLYYYQDLFKNEQNTKFIKCTLNEKINYDNYTSFDKYFIKNNGNEYFMHHKIQERGRFKEKFEKEVFEIEKLNSNNKNLENLSIIINREIKNDKLSKLTVFFEIGGENLSNFNKAAIDEYKDIIKLIGNEYNYPFDLNIGNFIFDFNEKTVNISINKCTNGFENSYYEIKFDKDKMEIIKEGNPSKMIYSSKEENFIGTNIEITKVDRNEFSIELFTLLNEINQKYYFMDFNFEDYNQFKINTQSINKEIRNENFENER